MSPTGSRPPDAPRCALELETARRFKGQSAECIVVAGIDIEALSDDVRPRLYAAMTWMRLKLALVVSPTAERLLLDRQDTCTAS